MDESGTLDNFKGTLDVGYATTVYRIGDGFVRGSKVFASWSTVPDDAGSPLFYDEYGEGDYALVSGLQCSTASTSHPVFLSDGKQAEQWGTATECEVGPRLANSTAEESPPTIILNSTLSGDGSSGKEGHDNNVHLIVEEDSSYPSFMYSVWRPVTSGPASNASQAAELHHQFYVSSTTRLAEGIVSAVANGIMSGGGCVDLLSQFSVANTTYELGAGMSRVAPFGEYPSSSSVESMDEVEEIVSGVNVSEVGMICGLILMVVTGASFAGCLASLSRKPMDVFDRDAVIRAVALPNGGHEADITSPALKIYVRQADDNRFGMVISDEDDSRRGRIGRCLRRCTGARVKASSDSDGDSSDEGAPAPARGLSRTWSLPRASFTRVSSDGARPSLENLDEALEGPRRGSLEPRPVTTPSARTPHFVELIASPIPSMVRGGSQSVLRGLPAVFNREVTDNGTADTSSTDQGQTSAENGLSSAGTSSRSQKRLAGSTLETACEDGSRARPEDDTLSVPDSGASPASRGRGEDTGAADMSLSCLAEIEDDAASGRLRRAGRANIEEEGIDVDGDRE